MVEASNSEDQWRAIGEAKELVMMNAFGYEPGVNYKSGYVTIEMDSNPFKVRYTILG